MYKYILSIVLLILFWCSTECYAAPNVSAKSAIVIENSTGRVLYEKNAHSRMPMASTTKIMTAICALENSDPDTLITVSDAAVGIEGSSIYLAKDEKITIRDLLYGMMLNSGNDAATALACEVSGSVEEFAKVMNKTAQNIGAKGTNFVNACGLYEDEHYTTASDLALITAYGLKNPVFAQIVSTYQKKISNSTNDKVRVLKNHNRLLRQYDGCIGVKTGYTKKCGRCLVTSAQRGGITLTCVTLNAPDDWNDHTALLDYGFSRCQWVSVANEDDYCTSVKVLGGTKEYVAVSFKEALGFVSIDGVHDDVSISYDFMPKLKAPLNEGQSVGVASLYIGGILCDKAELICAQAVPLPPRKSYGELLAYNIKSFFSLYTFS